MALAALCLPASVLAQDTLDAPSGTRVIQVETIPALADYARARVAQGEGDDETAIANYRKILPYATDPAVATQIFKSALVVGDRQTALAVIAPFTDMSGLPIEAPLLKIAEAVRTGDWQEARRLTDNLANDTPFDFLAPSLRAWIAVGAGERNPASHLTGLRRGSLEQGYAQRTAVLIIAAKGSRAEASEVVGAIDPSNGSVIVRLSLADRLIGLGDKEGALSLLEGDDPLISAAREQITAGRKIGTAVNGPVEGIALLFSDLAGELAPEGVTGLALNLQRIADFLAPNNTVSPILLATYLTAEDYKDPALRVLTGVKAKSPYYEAARERKIELLAKSGRETEAVAAARDWTKADSRSPAAWEALGSALLASGDHDGAIDAYSRQLGLIPEGSKERWRPLFLMGSADQEAGRWPKALVSFENALALAPREASVLNALGYGMIVNGGDTEKAIGYLRNARMIEPANAAYADSLGWAYVLAGDPARGAAILESAVKIAPGDPTYNEHLGDAYWHSGRKVEARYSWTAARVFAEPEQQAALDARMKDGPPPK